MTYFFKFFISLYLLNGWALGSEQSPAFSFSKEKGIQPLPPSVEQTDSPDIENKDSSSSNEKRSIQALTSPITKQKEISENKNPSTPNKRNKKPNFSPFNCRTNKKRKLYSSPIPRTKERKSKFRCNCYCYQPTFIL